MSIVTNIIYAITGIHCCFSSSIISCCATFFVQLKCKYFYGLAFAHLESKALYYKGCTACKQT